MMGSGQTRSPSHPLALSPAAICLCHCLGAAALRRVARSFGLVSKSGMDVSWSVTKWNGSGNSHPTRLADRSAASSAPRACPQFLGGALAAWVQARTSMGADRPGTAVSLGMAAHHTSWAQRSRGATAGLQVGSPFAMKSAALDLPRVAGDMLARAVVWRVFSSVAEIPTTSAPYVAPAWMPVEKY